MTLLINSNEVLSIFKRKEGYTHLNKSRQERTRSLSCPKTKIRNNKVNSQIRDFLRWKNKKRNYGHGWMMVKKLFFYKKECLMYIDVSCN